MSAQPTDQQVKDTTLDAVITGIVPIRMEENGSKGAALRALAHVFIVLLADADRSVSRGFLRGLFSQFARPAPELKP